MAPLSKLDRSKDTSPPLSDADVDAVFDKLAASLSKGPTAPDPDDDLPDGLDLPEGGYLAIGFKGTPDKK